MRTARVLLCAGLTLSAAIRAEPMYVLDRVEVPLRAAPSANSPVIQELPGGAPLDVLARQGAFAQVRAPDGTIGWMDAEQLMAERPAQLIALESSERLRQSREELAAARSRMASLTVQVDRLAREGDCQQTASAAIEGSSQRLSHPSNGTDGHIDAHLEPVPVSAPHGPPSACATQGAPGEHVDHPRSSWAANAVEMGLSLSTGLMLGALWRRRRQG